MSARNFCIEKTIVNTFLVKVSVLYTKETILGLNFLSSGEQREPKALPGSDFNVVPNWPSKETADSLGQISGVAVDIYGNAIIFHRGDRTWNGMTFKG